MENAETKFCPYCDEEIKVIAVKCRYCKSSLDKNSLINFEKITKEAMKDYKEKTSINNVKPSLNGSYDNFNSNSLHFNDSNGISDNADEIYYFHNEERQGPVNEKELIELIKKRILNLNSMVWRKDFSRWQPISNTSFDHYVEEPPPLSGDVINNTVVWWLAFAPLLGLFVEYVISSLTGIDIYNLFFITIILNIYLGYLDDKLLKKAGYNTNLLGIVWFVPVYLFRRASILKQSNAYGIVWCITFVFMFLLY